MWSDGDGHNGELIAALRAERELLEREIHDRGLRLMEIHRELVDLGAIPPLGGHG